MRDIKALTEYARKLALKTKEKILFKEGRKSVDHGAHGTQKYIIKKGTNKGKVAEHKSKTS